MRPENSDLARKDEKAQRPERVGTSTRDIAHEFNNVLNSILMSAKLLRMGRPADEQQHLLKVLEASAQRGAEMVKGLLTAPVH
jgi:two-component system, cell cycle sensor histidine kinase and response regulator CckA